jgi:hypothetical protein
LTRLHNSPKALLPILDLLKASSAAGRFEFPEIALATGAVGNRLEAQWHE